MSDSNNNAVDRLIANNQKKQTQIPVRNASLNKEDILKPETKSNPMIDLHTKVQTLEVTEIAEPVRKTLRLDPEILRYMDLLCLEHKITKDNIVEALIELNRNNQKSMDKVIKLAQSKRKQRLLAGDNKRFKKSLEKQRG